MFGLLRLTWVLGAILAADLALAVRPAAAGVFTLLSDPGYYNNGSPVSAIATITTANYDARNGLVTIDLTNTEDPTLNMGQVLTGFTFTLSNGATKGTDVKSSADVVFVNSQGKITAEYLNQSIFGSVSIGGTSYAGWTLGVDPTGAGPYLSVFGTGGPNFGGLYDELNYSSSNGSITGNSPHNPFSRGTFEFVMKVAGVTSATSVTGGTFQFGTNQNSGYVISVPDKVSTTPEPSSLACWCLLGLGSLGLTRRGRKNRSSAA